MYILFPLFAGLLPVHALYGANFGEISLKNYVETLLILSTIIISGVLGLNYFLHDLLFSGLIFTFIYFALLYANYINISLFSFYKRCQKKHKIIYTFSYILIITLISLLVINLKFIFPIKLFAKLIFWTSSTITFFVLFDIITKHKKQQENNLTFNNEETSALIQNTPNIYHLVLDSHSGFTSPSLADTWFAQELEKRGFTIYKNAKSNYNYTSWSLPSLLNYDYIQNFIKTDIANLYHTKDTLKHYGNNKFYHVLKSYGYDLFLRTFTDYAHLLSGKNSFIDDANFTLNKLLKVLSYTSIFAPRVSVSVKNHLLTPLETFKKICIAPNSKPKYCFTHILAPHTPYFTDESGNPNKPEDYRSETKFNGYQKYVNKCVIETLDKILPNIDDNTIILIHSDHSVKRNDNCIFNILCCAKFPSKYNPNIIPQDVNLVNLLRYLLNGIFNQNLEILNNKYYYANIETMYVKEADIQ